MRIGVLALQGAFREHRQALEELGAETVEVRQPSDLEGIDGLVIPGGESTTIRLLMKEFGLEPALRDLIDRGTPVLGTCAGMILLARQVDGNAVPGLDALDVSVIRNAFGRQVDSFEEDLAVPELGEEPFHAVFIRAPVVDAVDPGVEVLARLDDGRVVAVQEGPIIGLAFHPELTSDRRFHRRFLELVERARHQRTERPSVEETFAHSGHRDSDGR
jgi:5'-phosphate synthase pdxT subunit